MTSYIGITGFTAQEQVQAILQDFTPPSGHKFMVGVLCGAKTLRGISTQWDSRRPSIAGIGNIFTSGAGVLNMIHFRSASSGDALLKELITVTNLGGPNLDGLQLNMTWPEPNVLQQYRSQFPRLQIVLQVGRQSFEEILQDPMLLVNRLREYRNLIDNVLLDKSEGLGRTLDVPRLLSYMERIYSADLAMGIVIAGGLSAETLWLIKPLVELFPELSIDAEGQLRTSGDTLDIKRCRAYLAQGINIFQ